MADENTPPPPNDAPPATPETPAPNSRTFTQEDVDRIVNERLARDRQRRTEPTRTAPPPAPTKSDPPALAPSQPDALTDILRIRDDFDDAISDLTLTGAQKKFIRDLVMEKRPGDVGALVRTTAALFGAGKATAPNPTAPAEQPAPKSTPQGAPVTGNGAPAGSGQVTDDVPIMRLSEADRLALQKRIGIKAFTDRMFKEFRETGTRVRLRG